MPVEPPVPPPAHPATSDPHEARLVLLLGAVQLVNVLDFMMVMPLGPDLAQALAIDPARLGQIGGAYTAAASVAGVLGLAVLDRLDRRTALLLTMLGLFAGTLAGAAAVGFRSLVAARMLAGAFGGPASAVALAIVADLFPPERRGRALGRIMGAFSVSSVVGVPLGLELARLGGWRLPFVVVAGLGLLVAIAARRWLPSLRGHLHGPGGPDLAAVLRLPGALPALAMAGLGPLAAFMVIPNFPQYFQHNMGFPREWFGGLYLVGGALSFGVLRAGGRAIDRAGSVPVAALGTLLLAAVLTVGFVRPVDGVPVLALFVTFMAGMSLRNVAVGALGTKVPDAEHRAGFLSLQSTFQHAFAAVGAVFASSRLVAAPDGSLRGMEEVGAVSLVVSVALLAAVALTERAVIRGRVA